jgi:hypothetical protein
MDKPGSGIGRELASVDRADMQIDAFISRRHEQRVESEGETGPRRIFGRRPSGARPAGAAREAFVNVMDRLGAAAEAPPEHPVIEAARNSSAPEWAASFYDVGDPDAWVMPVQNLSEGAL